MHFGQSERGGTTRPDPSQRRLVSLLIFASVLLVVLFVLRERATRDDSERPPVPPSEGREGVAVKLPPASDNRELFPPIAPPSPVGEAAPLEGEFDWSAVRAADATDDVSPEGLAYLLQRVRTDPTWVNEPLPATDTGIPVTWETLLAAPEAHRGRAVYVEGSLVAYARYESPLGIFGLPVGNASGVDRYFRAFLFDGSRLWLIAVWRHSGTPFADGDPVRVRGRFLQRYTYEVEQERGVSRLATVPVLVADSFTRLGPSQGGNVLSSSFYVVVVMFGAVFLAVLLVVLWIFKRGNARFESTVRELRARRRSTRRVTRRQSPAAAAPGADGGEPPQ